MTIRTFAAALALGGLALAPAAGAQRYAGGYPDARYAQPWPGDARPGDEGGRGDDARRHDPRAARRCGNGTAGTIIGALAGGLLGRAVDGRGDRALGTVLGAGAGALAGRAVERSNNPGYCR